MRYLCYNCFQIIILTPKDKNKICTLKTKIELKDPVLFPENKVNLVTFGIFSRYLCSGHFKNKENQELCTKSLPKDSFK